VLVVPGVEVGTAGGHYAIYGVPGPELEGLYHRGPHMESPSPEALDSLATFHGGVTIVAHPRGGRKPWRGEIPSGAAGIEIMNGDIEWRNDPLPDLVRALFFFPFDSRASLAFLIDRPSSALALWDSLLQVRPTVGVAALDAHGGLRLGKRASLPFPSYRAVMALTRQHLLVPAAFTVNKPDAARVLLDALAAGRSFAGCDALGSTRGFAFWGESPEGPAEKVALMGEVLPLRERSTLHARLPRGAPLVVRLLLDGVAVAEERSWEFEYPVKRPGAYRVEVYQRRYSRLGGSSDLPWIFSNPIYVADRAGRGMPD